MSLYQELKRRNVFRVAIAYLALAWLLIEVAGTLFPRFGIPAWAFRFVVILLALGFIPTLIFSWAYEITPEGVKREKEVARLKVTMLGDAPKTEETNPEVYALYLQARHLARLGTSGDWELSNTLYQRALAIDPNYAKAWSGLAKNYTWQASWGLRPFDEGFTLARGAAFRARSGAGAGKSRNPLNSPWAFPISWPGVWMRPSFLSTLR